VRQLYEAARFGKERLLDVFGQLVGAETVHLSSSEAAGPENPDLTAPGAPHFHRLELELGDGVDQNRMTLCFTETAAERQWPADEVSAGLISHFRQAWQLSSRLSKYDGLSKAMLSVMDRYPAPLMAFNSDFDLVFQSASAREWLLRGENTALINDNFLALVDACCTPGDQHLSRLDYDDGRSVLILSRSERRASSAAYVDVFFWLHVLIIKPTAQIKQHLQQGLGLTQAERQLACHLLNGSPIKDFAVDRNIAESTVRKQLKTIMKKQGVHSQEALIHALHDACLAFAMSGKQVS